MLNLIKDTRVKVFFVILFLIIFFLQSVFIVNQTQQAILLQFGKIVSKNSLAPGMHFKIPFIQKEEYFENRVLGFASQMREAIAFDQKRVLFDTYTKYKIINPLKFYQSVKNERNLSSRVSPIVESITREAIAKVSLSCFVAECRNNSVEFIKKQTEEATKQFGIEIVDVRIKSVGLPTENLEAIFSRMKTDREKEAKEIRALGLQESSIIKSSADKESAFIISDAQKKSLEMKGKADAESTEIYNKAFGVDIEYFQYLRYIDIYKKTINKNNTFFVLNQENDYLKFLLKNFNNNNK
jgi:membrane protease subunit HflC